MISILSSSTIHRSCSSAPVLTVSTSSRSSFRQIKHLSRLIHLLRKCQRLPDATGIPVSAISLNSLLMAAFQFSLIEF